MRTRYFSIVLVHFTRISQKPWEICTDEESIRYNILVVLLQDNEISWDELMWPN